MNKTYLGLGIGPGMGLATAIRFAREGYRPILIARNAQRLAVLADELLKATNVTAEICPLDVAVAEQMQELGKRWPAPDVVHFNAARVHAQELAQADWTDFAQDIDTGITAALYTLKALAPGMLARQSGTILFTGGILGQKPLAQYLTLGIAKAGISNMIKALFADFARQHVHMAQVTVAAAVAPHSAEASAVAELFWELHCQPEDQWTWDVLYK